MKVKSALLLIIFASTLCIGNLAAQQAVFIKKLNYNGKPMIFLPHIGCSSDMWESVAQKFMNTNSCYLIDFAGFAGKPFTYTFIIKRKKLKKETSIIENYLLQLTSANNVNTTPF